MSANSVVLEGRLVDDVEVRHSASGKPWARYSIAVPRAKPREGEPDAHFFDVTSFGVTSERLAHHGRRGRLVLVAGELVQDAWTDKESGEKRRAVKVVGWKVTVMEGKSLGDMPKDPAPPVAGSGGEPAPLYEDDTPF